MEIDKEKTEEYRRLLQEAGYAKKTVKDHISKIEYFLFVYGDDLSNENIEEYADGALSYDTKMARRRSIEMFRQWILDGKKPKRAKHYVIDKSKEEPPKEVPPRIYQTVNKLHWDNMYNRPAFYKDSHSAQWI